MILGIRWHDFVRNTEVVDRTGLPCVRDVIAGRRNSLFGHVVRLDDHTPALSHYHNAARTGSRFGPGWRRRPGRPSHSWIQQIGYGTPISIRAEWSKARHRGHSGLTQRTSAVYAIWWWWRWWWWCRTSKFGAISHHEDGKLDFCQLTAMGPVQRLWRDHQVGTARPLCGQCALSSIPVL